MKAGRESIGTFEELHAAAREATGLDDFGAGEYVEGLRVLLDSYERDAGLTPWGNRITAAQLRGALIARLLCEASAKQHPQHAAAAIERPIIVTGLPRTGTTALHRLLCEDPAHQGLETWLTEAPQPRPPRHTWEDNPIFQRVDQRYRKHYVEHPEFMGAHEISAGMVEECWQLLRQSMLSVSFQTLAHIPAYARWLQGQDWTPAYQRHRKNLQVIGLGDTRRWALKNPSHLFALPALLAVYPDACIVQTHREPATVIASVSSLSAQATEGQSDVFHGETIGRDQLELWAHGAELFMHERKRYDPSQFFDVRYDAFVADPLATVEAIYTHFGLSLSDDARDAMARLHASSTSAGARPAHRYDLSDFALTAAEVNDRFAAYISAHLT